MHNNKERKKYRNKLLELLSRGNVAETDRRVRTARYYDMYYNSKWSDGYENLLTLHETMVSKEDRDDVAGITPFVKMRLDSISPKINLLIGELMATGFEPQVIANNLDAYKRKRAYRAQMEHMMNMQALFEELKNATGIEYGMNENLPKNEEELNEHMDRWRDVYEMLMEEAMVVFLKQERYEYNRMSYFLDLAISNEIHGKIETIDDKMYIRRINPLNIIYDTAHEQNIANDKTFALEAYYMPIATAIEKYGVKEEEMSKLAKDYAQGRLAGWNGMSAPMDAQTHAKLLPPFMGTGGGMLMSDYERVLIVEGEWVDVISYHQKVTYDKNENLHVHNYFEGDKNAKLRNAEKERGGSLDSKPIQVVKKAVLVAGDICVNYGVKSSAMRSLQSPQDTCLDYISVTHMYNNQQSTSMVARLESLQNFKDYVMTVMQKEITTNLGSFVEVDASEIDEATYGNNANSVHKVLLGIKSQNLLVTNKARNKDPRLNGQKTVSLHEHKIGSIINDAVSVMNYIDTQIDMISGINEARQGTAGERSLVGTQQMKMGQSNLMTEALFSTFFAWEKELLRKLCYHIADDWVRNPEKWSIVGDRLNIVIPEDFQIDAQDWMIDIQTRPVSREELKQAAMASVEQGNLTMDQWLMIMKLTAQSLKRGIDKYMELSERNRKAAAEAQQAEMQAMAAEKQADRESKEKIAAYGADQGYAKETDKAQIMADANRFGSKIKGEASKDASQQKALERLENAE